MRRLLAGALALGCAARPATTAVRSYAQAPSVAAPRGCGSSLDEVASGLVGSAEAARSRVRALGVALDDARGATSLVGEPEQDDVVRSAEVVLRAGRLGAVLVATRCGNATLLALSCDGAWRSSSRVALVAGARPGACRVTAVRAEAAAVFNREATELLVAWSSEREDGDSERATTFSAFRLTSDGALGDLTGPVAFGGEDDATGAGVEGRWFVDDVLPPPRDVVLELRPSHPGVDGVALTRIEREVWRPAGARLVRVARETERLAPRPAASAPRLAPTP